MIVIEGIILPRFVDCPFLVQKIFRRINIEGGKVMKRPIIAMRASTDRAIAIICLTWQTSGSDVMLRNVDISSVCLSEREHC